MHLLHPRRLAPVQEILRFNQGIGTVDPDGTETIRVSNDTTWTLTATNGAGSVSCSASVDIRSSGGGGSSKPRCDLEVSEDEVEKGDYVILSWDNRRTSDIRLEDDHGKTYIDTKRNDDDEDEYDEDEDSIRVKVTKDTEFTLFAIKGSRDDDCSVEVDVEDGEVAGISFTGTRYQDMINLAALPYTGFEAGAVLTFFFYLAIALWAAVITYALILKRKNDSVVAEAAAGTAYVPTFAENLSAVEHAIEHEVSETVPDTHIEEVPVVEDNAKSLEDYAHANFTLISSDGLAYIQTQKGTLEEQIQLLDSVIRDAQSRYPKEGDWLVLSKERILSLRD